MLMICGIYSISHNGLQVGEVRIINEKIYTMEQHEKKAAFTRQAEKNKENFNLHRKLIEKHFGKVEDSFLLTAMAYSEEYAALRQPLVSGELCRCTGVMEIEKVDSIVWCKKCRKKFLAA